MANYVYRRVDPERNTKEAFLRWFSYENFKRAAFPLLFIVITTLTFILVILLVLVRTSVNNREAKNISKLCETKACLKSGLFIQTVLNEDTDPCEDFYKFTCGGFLNNEDMPNDMFHILKDKLKDKLKKHVFNMTVEEESPVAVRKLSDFYQSCLQSELSAEGRQKRATSEIAKFNTLANTARHASSRLEAWIDLNTLGIQEYGDVCVICVSVVQNAFRPSEKIIMIKNPPIDIFDSLFQMGFYTRLLNYFGANEILLFNYEVQKIKPKPVAEALTNEENYMTIKKLSQEIPSVNWHHLIILSVEESPSQPKLGISETEVIFVNDLRYLRSFVALVESNTFNLDVAKAIFEWQILIHVRQPLLMENIDSQSPHLSLDDNQQKDYCMSAVSHFFNYAVFYIYDQTVGPSEKEAFHNEIFQMTHYLKDSFKIRSKTMDWLDEGNKRFIQMKLESLRLVLDIAPWSSDIDQVNNFYSKLNITSDFYDNYFSLRKYFRRLFLDELRLPLDEKEMFYGMPPSYFNAAYYPANNIIALPGRHKLPVFDQNRPRYLNFGSLGFMLGHEINHAFGIQGSRRDAKGKVRASSDISKAFDEKYKCFVDHYNDFKLDKNYDEIGELTKLEENIADSEGLRHAFEAYKQWEKLNGKEQLLPGLEKYSPEQLFFISFGSTLCNKLPRFIVLETFSRHSTHSYRVNTAVSNLEQFSDAFNCTVDSAMNPRHKCTIYF